MLLSPFTSPRRLALVAVLVFLAAIAYLSSTPSYRGYLPQYDIPGFASSNEEDQSSNGHTEKPAGNLDIPVHEPARAGSHEAAAPPPEAPVMDAGDHEAATPDREPVQKPSPAAGNAAAYKPSPLPHRPYAQVQAMIQQLIRPWRPEQPQGGHWPPYEEYIDKDYNPNRWEGFDFDVDFYVQNGIESLKSEKNVELEPYLPYPNYDSTEYNKHWIGEHVSCVGPRGRRLNESAEDIVKAFSALPHGFPEVAIGDAGVTGVDTSKCFDRYHRYGPYGLGQDDRKEVKDWQEPFSKPDWSTVGWGRLQDECVVENKERWAPKARVAVDTTPVQEMPNKPIEQVQEDTDEANKPQYHHRTALLIRTWEGYTYTENDLQAIRALITELSLLSGGEYQVFLFVNIKDNNANLFDEKVRRDLLASVPRELQDISILWNEGIMQYWYPDVTDWQVYWHQFMPLQWFMETHPEFDYVWNWETDARYTGNHYQFLEAMAQFSRNTPRKYMWERNQRFYFPDAHGTYSQWLNDTDWTIEKAMEEDGMMPVWGPQPYNTTLQIPIGPKPPHSMKDDAFTWGVGEEADLITLQPIWDPKQTEWSYRSKIWNFIPDVHPVFHGDADPNFDHPDFKYLNRRVYINTLSRFSRRQLHAMHLENLEGRAMQAEMWPATVALHHGLKAVYAPHPIWTDRKWPGWYMDAIFNADGNELAQWGERFDSVYNHDREYNFQGWSWYYASKFPKTLYRRWLGWTDKDDTSPLREVSGPELEETGGHYSVDGRPESVGGKGRMCLPGMLLHPVKKVVENE
ncbi:hypothetical protein WHR41_05365 [Cladosporium halotolerans]|uniref:Uncharacterized protein n=1 Tax=Cladosporium halotolerans TaxID=1052096 RepID=A0AB34KSP7_9PEZI